MMLLNTIVQIIKIFQYAQLFVFMRAHMRLVSLHRHNDGKLALDNSLLGSLTFALMSMSWMRNEARSTAALKLNCRWNFKLLFFLLLKTFVSLSEQVGLGNR